MVRLLPSDVVVVRTPGFWSWLIRLGQMLQGKPDLRNHVAMFHHTNGVVNWYLEGRPSGLGWRAVPAGADGYALSKWSVSNAAQPRTDVQRARVCARMASLMGKPYDWEAIEEEAAIALRLPRLWPNWGNGDQMPGHVMCSSSAAWSYRAEAVAAPEAGDSRFTEPADWDDFIMTRGWKSAPVAM